ncbi:MAG: pentapeptide repeat-containing protein, partial [Planctomycetaceae bacterium]|nr:pentapeptide repeat-containing protein [Planctomycetaceae bacterium]
MTKKTFGMLVTVFVVINACFYSAFSDVEYLPLTEYIVVDGVKIKLEDGLDLSGKDLRGIEIHYRGQQLKNIDFSGCNLEGANFEETGFDNCSFREAKLLDLPHLWLGINCDLTDAEIENIKYLICTQEQLKSTATFKAKSIHGICFGTNDFRYIDFSGFNLKKIEFNSTLLNGCNFTDTEIGEGCALGNYFYFPIGMTFEQLQFTKSYKDGTLINVHLNLTWPEGRADFSGMNLTGCSFGIGGTYNHVEIDNLGDFRQSRSTTEAERLRRNWYPNVESRGWSDRCQLDLTDSVITNCDFRYFNGLTLDNIKSTWNYKHGRMEEIKLPDEIQKALDAEKRRAHGLAGRTQLSLWHFVFFITCLVVAFCCYKACCFGLP